VRVRSEYSTIDNICLPGTRVSLSAPSRKKGTGERDEERERKRDRDERTTFKVALKKLFQRRAICRAE